MEVFNGINQTEDFQKYIFKTNRYKYYQILFDFIPDIIKSKLLLYNVCFRYAV